MSDDELEWVFFGAGKEPAVLTGNLCEFFGGCDRCPGFTTAGEVNPDYPPDAPVFCSHRCHKVPTQN